MLTLEIKKTDTETQRKKAVRHRQMSTMKNVYNVRKNLMNDLINRVGKLENVSLSK